MTTIPKTVNLLKFESVDVIGSYSDTKLKYFSDVDVQEFLETDASYQDILEAFQEKVLKIANHPEVFFSDFKLGVYNRQPLHWTVDEILKGEKHVEGGSGIIVVFFTDALQQESVIKIDVIAVIKNELVDITTNYYFDFTRDGEESKTFPDANLEKTKKSLLFEYSTLKGDNFYKALKRLYTYYKLIFSASDKSGAEMVEIVKALEALRKVFNSKLGSLNKQLSSLKTLRDLIEVTLEEEKRPTMGLIHKVYQSIRSNLSQQGYNLESLAKNPALSREELIVFLDENIDELEDKLEDAVKNFLKKSNLRKEIRLL